MLQRFGKSQKLIKSMSTADREGQSPEEAKAQKVCGPFRRPLRRMRASFVSSSYSSGSIVVVGLAQNAQIALATRLQALTTDFRRSQTAYMDRTFARAGRVCATRGRAGGRANDGSDVWPHTGLKGTETRIKTMFNGLDNEEEDENEPINLVRPAHPTLAGPLHRSHALAVPMLASSPAPPGL